MKEPNGCPECGAPRAADNTPSCHCAERAAQALREARTAEAAAAEDFDPLRIRPYVNLETPAEAPPPLPPTAEPADFSAFDDEPVPDQEDRPRRGRRTALLVIAAAAAALTTATVASGLFSYDTPSRDTALPHAIRASVPDTTPTETPRTTRPPTTLTPPSPAPPPSATTAPRTPSPSPTTAPSTSTPPTRTPSTVTATGTIRPPTPTPQPTAPVLRRGDHGPEVAELQLRLRRLALYTGDANGNFNAQVENAVRTYQSTRGITADEPGVYGAATRARLEAETPDG